MIASPITDPSEPESYKPVALTEFFTYILVKVLKTGMVENVEALDLFGSGQHGFRKQGSTTSNILQHHEMILE